MNDNQNHTEKKLRSLSENKKNTRHKKHILKIRKKRNIFYVCGIAIFLVLAIMMIVKNFILKDNPLSGMWDLDGTTKYEFRDDQTGALVLPSRHLEFTYTTKDDVITIDFADEAARDAEYKYTLNGDTLTLVGGYEHANGTYTLKKEK